MNHWDLHSSGSAEAPRILSSSDEGRAVLIQLAAGECLGDHQVHERAWVTVADGTVEATASASSAAEILSAPALVEFAPGERHELRAITNASVLLLLTPWPGSGHPGATALDLKANARELSLQLQGGRPT